MASIKEAEKKDAVPSLADNFRTYFSVALANSPELLDEVYRLRYRVYCEEFAYESAESLPDRKEIDSFDGQSVHCLFIHKRTGLTAGGVRLVKTGSAETEPLLPLEKFCGESLDRDIIDRMHLDRETICEISRLAVDAAFRRRSGESQTRFGLVDGPDNSMEERRTYPLISVAAFLAATSLTELTRRTNVFAMMEPFLPRLMERSGICFQRVGRDMDYHGVRAPYFIKTQSALDNMQPELRDLYNAIYSDIAGAFLVKPE